MHDAALVRGVERVGDLRGDGQRLDERNRAAREPCLEVFALDQFHDEDGRSSAVLEAVDGGNVGVIQCRECPRFTLEACAALRISGGIVRQDFQRDVALQPGIAGAIDLAHAARAEPRTDLVWTETSARGEGHGPGL